MKEAWLKWLSDPQRLKDFDIRDKPASEQAFLDGYMAGALAMRDAAARVAEDNKLHWSRKCDPVKQIAAGDEQSLRIFQAQSAACFHVESDIRSIDPATLGGK